VPARILPFPFREDENMWMTILKNGLVIAAVIMAVNAANAATGNKLGQLAA
jgi:hypothetical protein